MSFYGSKSFHTSDKVFEYPSWQNYSKFRNVTSIEKSMINPATGFDQAWISDMGIDGPTFVPKSGYFLLIWAKVCLQKLAFS